MNATLMTFSDAPGVRFMPVVGGNMLPSVRPGDLVAVAPIDAFDYDSLYVLDVCGPCIHRCQRVADGQVKVSSDANGYRTFYPDGDQFSAIVLGIVTATCRVTDHHRMGILV